MPYRPRYTNRIGQLGSLVGGSIVALGTFALAAYFQPFKFVGDSTAQVVAASSLSLILFVASQAFATYFLLNDVAKNTDHTLEDIRALVEGSSPILRFESGKEAEEYLIQRIPSCIAIDNTHLR